MTRWLGLTLMLGRPSLGWKGVILPKWQGKVPIRAATARSPSSLRSSHAMA